MIGLYCTAKTVNNTTVVLIAKPCAVKKIHLFGGSKVVFVDAATVDAANLAMAAVTAGTVDPKAELQTTTAGPHDKLECTNNEIINFTAGVAAIGTSSGGDALCRVKVYTMGNPVPRYQGS